MLNFKLLRQFWKAQKPQLWCCVSSSNSMPDTKSIFGLKRVFLGPIPVSAITQFYSQHGRYRFHSVSSVVDMVLSAIKKKTINVYNKN